MCSFHQYTVDKAPVGRGGGGAVVEAEEGEWVPPMIIFATTTK